LPTFRSQGAGTIVNISSAAAHFAAPACTAYSASKFALEGLSEALAREVGVFGIKVVVVAPGGFRTNLVSNLRTPKARMAEYDGTPSRALVQLQVDTNGQQPGDPVKAAREVLTLSETVAEGKADGELVRLVLGSDALGAVQHKIAIMQDTVEKVKEIAKSTDVV
jgi:NAD(P)-dependent dehydrogenase (short-subunit alcohol dehydrogenase family)